MPRFKYTALDSRKKKVTGTLSAENAYAARKQLRGRSIHPTTLKEMKFEREGSLFSRFFKTSSKKLVIEFTKQMATMINSGIKLTEALSVLTLQASDARFRSALSDIRDRVVTGESFTEAISDYTDYFDVIYISMVRVGEMTGTFGPTLATISEFMEKRQKIEGKFLTAMIYPLILTMMGIAVMLFFTIWLIPQITEKLEETGRELPGITKFVMGISDTLTSLKWVSIIVVCLLVIFWALKAFFATQKGAYLRDRFILSIPLLGKIVKQSVVSRFTGTLSTLLSSGLPMADSLKIVSEVTGNSVMSNAIKEARDRILSGADISTPLKDSGVIDPTIAHMVSVGERSGELDSMLKNISMSLESSTDVVIERVSAVIEPVIIIFIAAGVGVLALSMLLPIIEFTSGM